MTSLLPSPHSTKLDPSALKNSISSKHPDARDGEKPQGVFFRALHRYCRTAAATAAIASGGWASLETLALFLREKMLRVLDLLRGFEGELLSLSLSLAALPRPARLSFLPSERSSYFSL